MLNPHPRCDPTGRARVRCRRGWADLVNSGNGRPMLQQEPRPRQHDVVAAPQPAAQPEPHVQDEPEELAWGQTYESIYMSSSRTCTIIV